MKLRFVAVAIGFSLAVFAARANDILAITETGENFNDLVVTFNGVHLSGVQITGAADGWTVELPSGFSWAGQVGNNINLLELPSITFDAINFTQPTFLTWDSEQHFMGSVTITLSPATIPNGGTGPGGAFDIVLNEGPLSRVPDAGTTAMLLGGTLTGLAVLRRFLRL